MVGMMLDKGTTKQDQFQIAAKLEKVGAGIYFGVDSQLLAIGGRMLKKDLPMVIDLLAEQLRYPVFLNQELTKAKAQLIGSQRQALEDPDSMAREAFALAIYPQGHPSRPDAGIHRSDTKSHGGGAEGLPCQALRPGSHDAGVCRRRGCRTDPRTGGESV
jgi:predicted Zn-dependent peptidase